MISGAAQGVPLVSIAALPVGAVERNGETDVEPDVAEDDELTNGAEPVEVVSPDDVANGPAVVENGVAEDPGKLPDDPVVSIPNGEAVEVAAGVMVVVAKGVLDVVVAAPAPVVTVPVPEEIPALFVLSSSLPPPQEASNPPNKQAAIFWINGDMAINLSKMHCHSLIHLLCY